MPKHHRMKPAEASSKDRQRMLDHTESVGSVAELQRRREEKVRKHQSDQIFSNKPGARCRTHAKKHHKQSPLHDHKARLPKTTDPVHVNGTTHESGYINNTGDQSKHKHRSKDTADNGNDVAHNSRDVHTSADHKDKNKHRSRNKADQIKSDAHRSKNYRKASDQHDHKHRLKDTAVPSKSRDHNRSTDRHGHKHRSKDTPDHVKSNRKKSREVNKSEKDDQCGSRNAAGEVKSNIKLIDNKIKTNPSHQSRIEVAAPAQNNPENLEYCPIFEEWPKSSMFPLHSLLTPEDVPSICSPPELREAWYMITAKYERFYDYHIPFMTSDSVKYAIWKHQLINVASGGRCDLILAWDKKMEKFLVVKLFTKKSKPELEELIHRATVRMFLNEAYSTPEFCGLIYVGDSCIYHNIGIVEEFIGTELRPMTLSSFIDNLHACCITKLPKDQQYPVHMWVVIMCIKLLDQLKTIHDYGAVLNTIRPETILVELDDDIYYTMPYFTHLNDVTFQTDILRRRASDSVLTKLQHSSKWFRLNGGMKDGYSLLSAGTSDDLFQIGKILVNVGRITKLRSIDEIAEHLVSTTSDKRPGYKWVRSHLVKILRNLEKKHDRRNTKAKSSKKKWEDVSERYMYNNSEYGSDSGTSDDDSSSDGVSESNDDTSYSSNDSSGSNDESSSNSSGSEDDEEEESADDGENQTVDDSSDQRTEDDFSDQRTEDDFSDQRTEDDFSDQRTEDDSSEQRTEDDFSNQRTEDNFSDQRIYDDSSDQRTEDDFSDQRTEDDSSEKYTYDDSLASMLEQIKEYERKQSKANPSNHS